MDTLVLPPSLLMGPRVRIQQKHPRSPRQVWASCWSMKLNQWDAQSSPNEWGHDFHSFVNPPLPSQLKLCLMKLEALYSLSTAVTMKPSLILFIFMFLEMISVSLLIQRTVLLNKSAHFNRLTLKFTSTSCRTQQCLGNSHTTVEDERLG